MMAFGLAALRGALVLGLALAAMPLLRRASAATRRLVLALSISAVVVLPVATAVLPPLRVAVLAADDALAVPPPLTTVAEPVTRLSDPRAAAATSSPSSAATVAPPESPSGMPSVATLLLALWALGAAAVLARFAVGLWRARLIARDARLLEIERVGSQAVEVRATRAVESPAVVGVFSPVVLLPHEAAEWSAERRRVVMQHELAHVARRDSVLNAVAQIACALHWFDPLAWLVLRRLRIERELAADDLVLAAGTRASTYAEHLLGLATVHGAVPAGALAMAQPSQIAVRIRALLAPERARAPLGRWRVVALATCTAVLGAAVACATPSKPRGSGASSAPVSTNVARRGGASLDAVPRGELTIDPALQAIAEEETDRVVDEWKPRAAVVIVLEPATGNILAMTSRSADGKTEVAAQHANLPGSTMKSISIAAALEEGAIRADQRFDCENGKRAYGAGALHDASPNGQLDVTGILTVSSNVGVSKIYDELGGAKLGTWLRRFHFGEVTPLQIAGVVAGAVPERLADRSLQGALVANGQMMATPIQIAAAYAAIANGGVYHAPTLARRRDAGERVLREETARTMMGMLEVVVTAANGTGSAARIENVRVGGKTGTAELPPAKPGAKPDHYASFVGVAPLENPRYVILVGVEAPRNRASGGQAAAPAFARIMKRALVR